MLDVFRRIARACGASRHASVAACRKARMSAHAHKMFVFVLSALVLCVSLHPTRAYAEVVWAETSDSLMSAYVYDYDYTEQGRRSALAEFVGYNWDTMSNSVKLKVLQDSTVAFCLDPSNRRCINVAYEWAGDIPVFSQAIEIVFSIFGRQRVWQCSMTSAEYFAVQDAFKNAVYPNDGSGSGGSVEIPEGYTLFEAGTSSGATYTLDSWTFNGTTQTWDFSNVMTLLEGYMPRIFISSRMYGSGSYYYNLVNIPTGIILLRKNGDTYNDAYLYNTTDTSIDVTYGKGRDRTNENSSQIYKPTSSSVSTGFKRLASHDLISMGSVGVYNSVSYVYYKSDTIPPYTPQPDPPAQQPTLNAPTAPSLPTTNAPTTPDSTPDNYTTIVNNNYTQPTYNQQPTGTSQDYTPWLDEIIVLLRSINDYIYMGFDDLSTWFSVVDADMRTGFDNVLARLSSLKTGVHSDLVWLADNLDDWISNAALYLATYLHDCEQYLGDIVGEYSSQIASVVTWLRRIYSRLGGNGASKPSVTTDEPGFFDWLIDLFTRFLNDLFSNLPEWLQRLIGGFQDLSEHFPFSIPWDIAAMLQLLYHEPVTPVFDLPMPTMEIDGVRSVNVHIDLSSWNGVAAIVREMVFIIFAVSLALNTKKLLSNLDM